MNALAPVPNIRICCLLGWHGDSDDHSGSISGNVIVFLEHEPALVDFVNVVSDAGAVQRHIAPQLRHNAATNACNTLPLEAAQQFSGSSGICLVTWMPSSGS